MTNAHVATIGRIQNNAFLRRVFSSSEKKESRDIIGKKNTSVKLEDVNRYC